MDDISKIKVDATTYNIKDATARSDVSSLSSQIVNKADKTQISNSNLIMNSWFTVNQRGSTSLNTTTVTYIVDRWQFARTKGSCHNDMTEGISVAWNGTDGTNGIVRHPVEKLLVGTITISALIDGTIYSKTITTSNTGFFEETDFIGSNIRVRTSTNAYDFILYSTTLTNITAVKLELGSISTLAMDTAPNYAEELLKCQRYYFRIEGESSVLTFVGIAQNSNTATIACKLTASMRILPSIKSSGVTLSLGSTVVNVSALAISGVSKGKDAFILSATTTGLQAGQFVAVRLPANSYIEFSADL